MKRCGFRGIAALLAALVMLALVPASSLADTVVTSERNLEREPELNGKTNTCIERRDGLYALYDAAGNQLSESYGYMSAKSDGLFLVVANEEGVNSAGLLDRHGQPILPMVYGQIEVISERWIMGIVLEATEDDPADYRALLGSGMYNIATVDVYFDGRKIGSLERSDYARNRNVTAYGSYLTVRKADASGYYLNSRFERIDASEEELSYYEYEEEHKVGVFHRASGQQAFVSSCTLTPEEVEQSVWYDDNGDFIDLQGNVISRGPYDIKEYDYVNYYGGGYLRARYNGKCGLVDLAGNEVLPPVYDALGGGAEGVYYVSGYQAVLQDGRLSYLDRAGNVTASVEYQLNEGDYAGFLYNAPFATVKDADQAIVITATAGELPQKYAETGYPHAGQRVLAVKLDEAWGVIDLQGNTVIPFEFRSQPEISADGTVVVGSLTGGGYKLYTISYAGSAVPMA